MRWPQMLARLSPCKRLCPFPLGVLERGLHGRYVCRRQSMRGGDCPPASRRIGDVRQDVSRFFRIEAKVFGHAHERIDAGAGVSEVDGRTEILRAWLRVGVEVERGR